MNDGRERRWRKYGYNFSSGSRLIGPSTGGELQQQQQQVVVAVVVTSK